MAYGLKPVGTFGGGYFTGGFQEFQIADSYGTAIYNGDCTEFNATTGFLEVSDGTPQGDDSADATAGVLIGCRYTDSNGQTQFNHHYPASAGASNVFGYVVPVDNLIWQASGTATWDINQVGVQVQLGVGSGGSDTSGNSSWVVTNITTDDPAGAAIITGVVDNENKTTSTPDVLFRFVPLASYWNI